MSNLPTLGRVVYFRSRTGNYTLSAEIIGTVESTAPAGIEAGHVPPFSSPWHVHLLVRSPARIAPLRTEAADFIDGSDAAIENPVNGLYREWDVGPMGLVTPGGTIIVRPDDRDVSYIGDGAAIEASAALAHSASPDGDDVDSPIPFAARTWAWPRYRENRVGRVPS